MKMQIISRFLEPRASSKNSLWGNTYSFFFGSTITRKIVNERTAMQTTVVKACVRILAKTIDLLPLHSYKYYESGKEKSTEHPIYNSIVEQNRQLYQNIRCNINQ